MTLFIGGPWHERNESVPVERPYVVVDWDGLHVIYNPRRFINPERTSRRVVMICAGWSERAADRAVQAWLAEKPGRTLPL